jgi:hypothetical protein
MSYWSPAARAQVALEGDALAEDVVASDGEGFAGLIVDLFADNAVLPALTQVQKA